MTIRPIDDPAAWNAFVTKLPHNSFLHSWEWGQVQRAMGEHVEYLGFFDSVRGRPPAYGGTATAASGRSASNGVDGNEQKAAALLIGVKAKRGWHWLCPHGPLTVQPSDYAKALQLLIEYVQRHSFPAVALRLAPPILNTSGNRLLLAAQGFRRAPLHVHAELTWVLDITPDEEQLLRGMRKTTRHSIRNAQQAGVTTEIISDDRGLDRFLPLYEQTRARHGFVPFSSRMLKAQLKTFCSHQAAFTVIASHHGRDIAAAILIHFGNTVYYYHGASLSDLTIPGPHYLQWQAIREAKRRRAVTYNFWGIAPDDQPRHPFAGITIFKKGFGGHAVDLLPAHDLPLSWRYWSLWAVDAWRKYRRGF